MQLKSLFFAVFAWLALPASLLGQVQVQVPAQAPAPAQNNINTTGPAVKYLRQHVDFDIRADGSNLQTHDNAMIVLSTEGVQEAKGLKIRATDSFGTTEVMSAYTLKKDGARKDIAVLNPAPAEQVIPPADAVRLRDEKYRSLDFPDVEVGDTVVWTYRRLETGEVTGGKMAESLVFPQSKLYDDVVVTVRAPANMRIVINPQMLTAGPVAEKADGRRESKWTYKNSQFVADAPKAAAANGIPDLSLPQLTIGYAGGKAAAEMDTRPAPQAQEEPPAARDKNSGGVSLLKLFFVYAIAGGFILDITMRLYGVRGHFWQALAASLLSALCVFLMPRPFTHVAAFVITVGFLRFTTRAEWSDIVYPVLITRVLVFLVVMLAVAHDLRAVG